MFDDIIIRPKKKNPEKKTFNFPKICESPPSNKTAEKEKKKICPPSCPGTPVPGVKKAKEMKKGEREDNISPKINTKGPGVNPNTRVKKAKVK